MSRNNASQGVPISYIFKNRLQTYTHKAGLSSPVYKTVKEGQSHKPKFRSTVIVNGVSYDSLPGFNHRRAAENSAAEIAFTKLAQSDQIKECTQPLAETGLCKCILQEYAAKMNFPVPIYKCREAEGKTRGGGPLFYCTVKIGEMDYIGGSASTKKEAEIKAARVALLATQSSPFEVSSNVQENIPEVEVKAEKLNLKRKVRSEEI